MKDYSYPDKNEKLTCLLINTEYDENYWTESEKNVLNMIITRIKKLPKKPNLLDLGCGMGRLFSVFAPYVESITGVDPDINRLNEAKKEARTLSNINIKLINGDISKVEQNTYETVLISHIFQHIPIKTIENIVEKLSKIVPIGGVVCTTTTFTYLDKDVYTIEYLKQGKRVSKVVDEEIFNNNISNSGTLPVREMSLNTMKKIFKKYGFELEKMVGYHFKKEKAKENLSIEYDNKMNNSGKIKNAKDSMYIFRKVEK